MGLYERLTLQPDGSADTTAPNGEQPPRGREAAADRFQTLKRDIHEALLEKLGPKLYDANLSAEQLERRIREQLDDVVAHDTTPLSSGDRRRLIGETMDDILGYGPLEPFLQDPDVTEIMVNGPGRIYTEREGRLHPVEARFLDDAHLRRTIDKIVAQVGRRIDEASPYVDARLSDGSRVNAIIPPVSVDGPALTIRKFSAEALTSDDLVGFGTVTAPVVEVLDAAVKGDLNLLISGGTGAGKTTTLNVMSSFIPHDERIVTIEDAAELRLQQPHVVRLEYRPPNIEGRGEISIRQLVRNALRMRPDRIVVGEVRGGETLDMLQAMNTGHDGSLTTVHANSPRDVLTRLETMVLMAGVDLPIRAIREQIAGAIDVIIHQSRLSDGTRRVTHVTEIAGMEGDTITLQDLFLFDYGAGRDEHGRFRGELKPTGIRPQFTSRLHDMGLELPGALFTPQDGPLATTGRRSR